MSWKLAEWRWREQAPLRERSLWKIWDVEDAVKNGDVVDEAVRIAYHFPDQGNGCWQSRIEIPRGRGLGSIRSGKNPHPPPRSQLPDLPPQQHTSYHQSHSSSAPLLGSFQKNPSASGESHSNSSLSALLSKSTNSTTTVGATPRTPQLATDFLDSRDRNNFVLDQEVNRELAVNQLQSSFGLFTKATQYPRFKQRPILAPQYSQFERSNTSAIPLLHRSFSSISQLHKRYQSTQDFDASLNNLPDRVVPWSNLDTVFEDPQFFFSNSLQHEHTASDICRAHQEPFEIPSEEAPDFKNRFHNCNSLLFPTEDMGRFNVENSEDDEVNKSKSRRIDTPPARVFEDLPAAYTGIVGQAGTPAREMRNMTGVVANLPTTIDLPRTPARPGPASPALQQILAEAKALRERQKPFFAPERPLTPLLPESPISCLRVAREGRLNDDTVPASDFVSPDEQIRELRLAISHEKMPKDRVLVRNSRSFFDLNHEYRTQENRPMQYLGSRAEDSIATSSTVHGEVDMFSSPSPPRASNVLVRNSRDIMGIAISGDQNYTLSGECRGETAIPAPLRVNRHRLPAGNAPRASLPRVPAGVQPYQYHQYDVPSSELAEYDNTQSLLNAGRPGPRADISESFRTQILSSTREDVDQPLPDVGGDPAITTPPKTWAQYSAATDEFGHELSWSGARQPAGHLPGLSQFKDVSGPVGMSASAPYHSPLKFMHGEVDNDETGPRSSDHALPRSGQSDDHGWTSSRLFEDEELSQLALGDQSKEHEVVRDTNNKVGSFRRNLGSAEWFANATKKESNMTQKGSGVEEMGDDRDWETVRGSAMDSDQPLSQAALQPPQPQPQFEPPLLLPFNKMGLRSDLSLADDSSSSFGSVPASHDQPATPWDPIQKRTTREHPALPGTPHKYRLRRNTSTGEEIYVPEYSLPEISSSISHADSAQAAPDLPVDHLFSVSKFSASTQRQPVRREETSPNREYHSSSLIFSQGRHKAKMGAAVEEEERTQGHIVHEVEGDQGFGIGVAISTDVALGEQARIHQAESVYSLASEDIVQDDPLHLGATIAPRPANIPGTRAAISYASSDEISMHDGMQYGEQGGGIEMERLGIGRDLSIGTMGSVSSRNEYHGNTSSQLSLGYPSRLMSQGRNESDEDILRRLSTIDDDGSYEGEEDIASTSSFMRANNPFGPRSAKSSKNAFLGRARKYRGSGLRGMGSSLAHDSSDIYDPATQRNHAYGELSSGPDSVREAGYEDNSDEITEPSVLTREQIKANMRNKGINTNKIVFGNVQKDVTGIIFPMGQAISAPKPFVLPRTVPATNSFILTKEMPLLLNSTNQEDALDRIQMAQDDWMRLNRPCSVFPLRHSHLEMKFVEGDPRRVGDNIYNRGGASRIHGGIEEDAFCFYHGRREFSVAPALHRMPLSAEMEHIRKKAGREVVYNCLCVPLVGWVLLYHIWKDEAGLRVDGELMRWKTGSLVGEMGREEKELAGVVLLWGALGLVGGLFACVAVLIWALL